MNQARVDEITVEIIENLRLQIEKEREEKERVQMAWEELADKLHVLSQEKEWLAVDLEETRRLLRRARRKLDKVRWADDFVGDEGMLEREWRREVTRDMLHEKRAARRERERVEQRAVEVERENEALRARLEDTEQRLRFTVSQLPAAGGARAEGF